MCAGLIIIKIALTLWSVVRSVNIMMPSNPRKAHGVREGMNICFCSLKQYTFTSVSYGYLLRRKCSYFLGVLNADMSRKTTKRSDSDGDDSDGLPPLLPCTSDEEVEKS